VSIIEMLFPQLHGGNYHVTSPATETYNCIAWAAGVTNVWWWPHGDPQTTFWPSMAQRQETVAAFHDAFASLGYIPCDSAENEPGFERVALYADVFQCPTHAARQLEDGSWTSKLGTMEDIVHALSDLEGAEYGTVVLVMKRARVP